MRWFADVRRIVLWGGVVIVTGAGAAPPSAQGPPPGHTGGFGEPTCTACHADAPLNDPAGALDLVGLPAAYDPGAVYELAVELRHPALRRAGFQLAVRFVGDAAAGRQAGTLASTSPRVGVQVGGDSVSYAGHVAAGTSARDAVARWPVRWTAPSGNAHAVAVHVAANASNDDDSELGDAVYAGEWLIAPRDPIHR